LERKRLVIGSKVEDELSRERYAEFVAQLDENEVTLAISSIQEIGLDALIAILWQLKDEATTKTDDVE
jgi:hypothetical protein